MERFELSPRAIPILADQESSDISENIDTPLMALKAPDNVQ